MRKATKDGRQEFTVDWFSNNIPTWREVLVPALIGKAEVAALEVGSYEGRSAAWTVENLVLGRPRGHLLCIDDFATPGTEATFRANMARYPRSRVSVQKGRAEVLLRRMPPVERFDLVYLDAGKCARDVLEQAVLVWPLLNKRGLLVFDDYTNSAEHGSECPKRGIDAFLDMYAHELKLRKAGWQVIVQKRSRPLARKACRSEFFHEDLAKI
jgi:predicted O-methyltransferase YrrM